MFAPTINVFFCFINKQKLLPILATCARRLPRIFVSYSTRTIETTFKMSSDYFMFQINRHLGDTNVKYILAQKRSLKKMKNELLFQVWMKKMCEQLK